MSVQWLPHSTQISSKSVLSHDKEFWFPIHLNKHVVFVKSLLKTIIRMARKRETTVQYTNGSEIIVKTKYHHGMHINHSMQVVLIYIMYLPVIKLPVFLSRIRSQSYSLLFSPCVLVVLVYNTVMAVTCHCASQGCGHLILAPTNHIPIQQQRVLLLNYPQRFQVLAT
jgi:hypothetical protein